MGDGYFETIHTPGHSSDSICLYNQAEGVLFAGDSPLLITSPTGTYEAGFLAALEKLCARDIRRIYFGHGAPLTERCNQRLRESQMVAAGSPACGDRASCCAAAFDQSASICCQVPRVMASARRPTPMSSEKPFVPSASSHCPSVGRYRDALHPRYAASA